MTSVEKLLRAASKDPDKKLVEDRSDDDMRFCRFEGPPQDRAREVRTPVYSYCIFLAGGRYNTHEDRYAKSWRRTQKFPCVNGPLAGQWVLHDDAPDYEIFNRARGCWGGLTAVLVHGADKI